MAKYLAKKRFGQNFLIDTFIINQIIQLIKPQINEQIIEIGPGLGALTKGLLEYTGHISAIELDRDLAKHLERTFSPKQVSLYNQDALKFDYSTIAGIDYTLPLRIVGNLPYNISTPLLFHLSKFKQISSMHFMLQQEVVERICAEPNSRTYGRLSVMLQYKYHCQQLLQISPEAFHPKPKVNSAIIQLLPKLANTYAAVNEINLAKVVTQAFSCRRKTLTNSLAGLITVDTLSKLNIDKQKRAENLTIEEFITLANHI